MPSATCLTTPADPSSPPRLEQSRPNSGTSCANHASKTYPTTRSPASEITSTLSWYSRLSKSSGCRGKWSSCVSSCVRMSESCSMPRIMKYRSGSSPKSASIWSSKQTARLRRSLSSTKSLKICTMRTRLIASSLRRQSSRCTKWKRSTGRDCRSCSRR